MHKKSISIETYQIAESTYKYQTIHIKEKKMNLNNTCSNM